VTIEAVDCDPEAFRIPRPPKQTIIICLNASIDRFKGRFPMPQMVEQTYDDADLNRAVQ
jgi:hypothetical protein